MIKLIIGIGNPDEQYKDTRHNVGFMMMDYIAKITKGEWFKITSKTNNKINYVVSKKTVQLGKNEVWLFKPLYFVNNIGNIVADLKKDYGFSIRNSDQLIVIQDDLDIPFGNTKISFDKNSGGHKGIESIMKALKTKKFYRLRIGLAKPALQKARQQSDKKRDEFVTNYVLSKFSKSESETLKHIFEESYGKLINILAFRT